MRSLVFDELNPAEVAAVEGYLARETQVSGVGGLYWLALSAFGPGRVAVELGPSWVRFELFRRTESLLNEDGGYLDPRETADLLAWAGRMAASLELKTC